MDTAHDRHDPPRADDTDTVESVGDVLDRVFAAAAEGDRTSLGDILDAIGTRSFGPLLLLAGQVMLAPLFGDIPGVPVMMGLIVLLTTAEFLLGYDHIWLRLPWPAC